MATTRQLFEFIQKSTNVAVEEHPLWESIASEIYLDGDSEQQAASIITFLEYAHYADAKEKRSFDELTEILFKTVFLHTLNLALKDDNARHLSLSKRVFHIWNIHRRHDISKEQADSFIPVLNVLFEKSSEMQKYVLEMIYRSATLWTFFEAPVLEEYKTSRGDAKNVRGLEKVIHRHTPLFIQGTLNSKNCRALYVDMLTSLSDKYPTIMKMADILRGEHHNALAWTTALLLEDNSALMGTSDWLQMSHIFSSLNLDPKDPEAWHFWHLLSTGKASRDASGQELIASLGLCKKEMASAFADAWSFIDALEEGDIRYERAAQMHRSNINELTFPDVDLHKYMI